MKFLVATIFVFLSACSTLPVDIQKTAAENIRLYQVINSVSAFHGKPVRWGGRIVSVSTDGAKSILEIEYLPVNRYGFPLTTHPVQGVFLSESDDFLDPEIYQQGLLVTLSGTITSQVIKTSKKIESEMPIITISHIHLWPYGKAAGKAYTHMGVESRYTGYGYYGAGSSDNFR